MSEDIVGDKLQKTWGCSVRPYLCIDLKYKIDSNCGIRLLLSKHSSPSHSTTDLTFRVAARNGLSVY
jgi:hypothetical protein